MCYAPLESPWSRQSQRVLGTSVHVRWTCRCDYGEAEGSRQRHAVGDGRCGYGDRPKARDSALEVLVKHIHASAGTALGYRAPEEFVGALLDFDRSTIPRRRHVATSMHLPLHMLLYISKAPTPRAHVYAQRLKLLHMSLGRPSADGMPSGMGTGVAGVP